MADILIRMDMPNSCVECSSTGLPVAVSILGASCPWCREMIDPKINLRIARHENCPLYTIPEHEDLIDKSELLENSKVNGMYPHWIDTMDVKRAPVIIPSNKEETE